MMDENEQEGAQRFYNKCSLNFNNITLRVRLHLLLQMALLFSFLLTFTSYNSYRYYLSALFLPLFTHTFEKKYLFLLCTTILTFITKKNLHLGLKENIYHDKLLYSLSEMEGATVLEGSIQEHEYGKLYEQESKEEYEQNMENSEKESQVLVEDEENIQEYEYGKLDEQESKEEYGKNTENSEKESDVLVEDEEADGGVSEEEVFLGGSSRAEEERAEVNMDTEELNKKIDEFIRKMREELRVEAEQHLITV
ncbi:hypothetical protein L1887_37312 [Cichorium endivia]|nr:hypothetical protein L1887_37312 [Cichorium endivia]